MRHAAQQVEEASAACRECCQVDAALIHHGVARVLTHEGGDECEGLLRPDDDIDTLHDLEAFSYPADEAASKEALLARCRGANRYFRKMLAGGDLYLVRFFILMRA